MCCFNYVLLLNFCYLSIMDKISKWCPFDIRVITSMKLFKTYGMCCNLHTYHFECILPLLLDYIMRGIMRIVSLLLCLIVFLDFCVGLILCQSSLFHNTCFSQENQLKQIIFPPYRQTMYLHTHRYVLQLFWISLNYFQLSSWFVGIASAISCYCFSWNYSKGSLPVPHTHIHKTMLQWRH